MKYNRALDHVLLALEAQQKGQPITAAQHFTRAVQSGDVKDAMRILEASNAQAHATKLKAKKRRIKASEEIVEDDDLPDGTNDGLPPEVEAETEDEEVEVEVEDEEDEEDEELLSGDLDSLEDSADAAEDEADIAEFAAVLASMRRKAGK